MKRAIRRHQQRVAKFRRARIVCFHNSWTWWIDTRNWRGERSNHQWQPVGRLVMNEPGRWIRQMMTRPARIRANQMLKLVENGRDPDLIQWPDNRKPHLYYW